MKTSLATALSIAGVLAAGALALEVNTRVLDSTISAAGGAPALAEAVAPVAALSVSTSLAPTPGAADANPQVQATQSAYNVEGTGVITLQQDAGSLSIVSVVAVDGFTYKSKNESSVRIEVEFVGLNQSIKFHAELLDGRIVTAIDSVDTTAGMPVKRDDNDGDKDHQNLKVGEGEGESESEGDDD